MLLLGYHQNLIIIRSPFSSSLECTNSIILQKKQISLYVRHDTSWHKEQKDILWAEDTVVCIDFIVRSWLAFIDEEQLMQKRVTLQSVCLSPTGQEAYLSFDKTPFSKDLSTFEKLLWVESLLKTIRENQDTLRAIYLLVNHQPINDVHIDCSHAIPIQGFIAEA